MAALPRQLPDYAWLNKPSVNSFQIWKKRSVSHSSSVPLAKLPSHRLVSSFWKKPDGFCRAPTMPLRWHNARIEVRLDTCVSVSSQAQLVSAFQNSFVLSA